MRLAFLLNILFNFSFGQNANSAEGKPNIQIENIDQLKAIPGLSEAQFLFLGELHEIADNKNIHYRLFDFLNTELNYKNILLELPRSSNRLIGNYFQSGNDDYLDSFLIQYSNAERYFDFFNHIYNLKKTDSLINVISVDIESCEQLALAELCRILEKHGHNSRSGNYLIPYKYSLMLFLKKKEMWKMAEDLLQIHNEEKEELQTLLSTGYNEYYRILTQLNIAIKSTTLSNEHLSNRERVMEKNILELCPLEKKEKYFFPVGLIHTFLDSNSHWINKSERWYSVAYRMRAKTNVSTSAIYYLNEKSAIGMEDRDNSLFINSKAERNLIRKTHKRCWVYTSDKLRSSYNFLIINHLKHPKREWSKSYE